MNCAGTYLALLSLTEEVAAGREAVDVLHTVLKLREKRPKMVQTREQFLFIHHCLALFIRYLPAVSHKANLTAGGDCVARTSRRGLW